MCIAHVSLDYVNNQMMQLMSKVQSYGTFLIVTALLGQVHNVFVFKGSNLLSVGEEGVLVRWQWKTHEQQFLPRLGAPIHHVAVSPDDSLTAISQKDNSECFLTIAFTFVYICQLWLTLRAEALRSS